LLRSSRPRAHPAKFKPRPDKIKKGHGNFGRMRMFLGRFAGNTHGVEVDESVLQNFIHSYVTWI
jgi:hypothetical protein